MSFRVTGNMMFSQLMSNMRTGMRTLGNLQEQMVTLRRINRPSDDPFGVAKAQSLRNDELDYRQYLSNMDQASSMLEFTAGVLQSMSGEIVNVRSKLMSALSPTIDQNGRDTIATEVNDILKSVIAEANSSFAGLYIFGGTNTDTQPFEVLRESGSGVEAVGFTGNAGVMRYIVGHGATIDVNENPIEVFMPRGEENSLMQTLVSLRQLLNNVDGLSEAAQAEELTKVFDQLDTIHSDVVRSLGRVGARASTLEMRRDLYMKAQIDLVSRRSDLEDADISDVALRLQNQQIVLQVILAGSSAVFNTNLIELLR